MRYIYQVKNPLYRAVWMVFGRLTIRIAWERTKPLVDGPLLLQTTSSSSAPPATGSGHFLDRQVKVDRGMFPPVGPPTPQVSQEVAELLMTLCENGMAMDGDGAE